MLQETQPSGESKPLLSGYTGFQCECPKCQGLITFVRNDLTARQVKSTTATEYGRTDTLIVEVWKYGQKYTCTNLYNPPKSELRFETQPGPCVRTIVGGDFNAKCLGMFGDR